MLSKRYRFSSLRGFSAGVINSDGESSLVAVIEQFFESKPNVTHLQSPDWQSQSNGVAEKAVRLRQENARAILSTPPARGNSPLDSKSSQTYGRDKNSS